MGDLRPPIKRVPGAPTKTGRGVLSVHQGTDRSCSRNHHPHHQRGGGSEVLKVLGGVFLGFVLFSNPEARQVTADLLRATANALAPATEEKILKEENTLQERVTSAVVYQITDKQ